MRAVKGRKRAVAGDACLLPLACPRSGEAKGAKTPRFRRCALSLSLASAAILLVASLVTACGNGEPLSGPENGEIIFTTLRFERERLLGRLFRTARGGPRIVGGVHRVLPDGRGLTVIGPRAYDSAVSPSDGSVARVVFDVPQGPTDIRVYTLDERGHRKKFDLTDTPDRCETSPAWSADGARIAFLSWPRDPELDCSFPPIRGWPATAPAPVQPLSTPVTEEAPASGETWLLEVMNADASGRVTAEVPAGDGSLLWAPNGKAIAVISYGPVSQTVLFRVDPDTLTEMARIMEAGPSAWSPDGTAFVYASVSYGRTPQAGETRIMLVQADGGDDTGGAAPREVARMPGDLVGTPNWSPDGSALAFIIGRPLEGVGRVVPSGFGAVEWRGSADLWLANRDGTGLRKLASSLAGLSCPTWSPDSSRIGYVEFALMPPVHPGYPMEARPGFLSVVDVETGETQRADPDPTCPFEWSHGGDRIAYVGVARLETKERGPREPPEEEFFWSLFVMSTEDGSTAEIADDASPPTGGPSDESRVAWSLDDSQIALLRNKGCRSGWCSYGRLHVASADGSKLDKLTSLPVESIIGWVERQPGSAP